MISDYNYQERNNCDYLDGNSQNAKDMLLNCISNKSSGEEGLCTSSFKLYDNIAFNSQYIDIKRGVSSGYGINPHESNSTNRNQLDFGLVHGATEGFTNYSGINDYPTSPGPGETNIEERCPQGYSYIDGKCVQVCAGCNYKDNMKSKEFNTYDKCFPNGVYDGIDKLGNRICSCGRDNKYCPQKKTNKLYHAGGYELETINFIDLFDYEF